MTLLRGAAAALALASLTAPPGVAAQVLELRLRDDSTRAPLAGAIVRLLGQGGHVAQGLTDELGRVTLRAPAPGQYNMRIDRIGFQGAVAGPVALAAGDTLRQELVLPGDRMILPTIVAEGESHCDLEQQGGTPAAALWTDIRTALTANLLTQERGAVPIRTTLFERDVTRAGTVGPERRLGTRLVTGRPFATLTPADLAARGFVYRDRDSLTYNGPDAALLLSDEFVATHCFRAVPGSEGLVGLAFEPAARRELTDVRGTLWVDRSSAELRFLQFHYTGLPGAAGRSAAGGRIDFVRLPNGSWIVSDWHLRMPLVVAKEVRTGPGIVHLDERLVGYLDRGGRARVASDFTESRPRLSVATLTGLAYDSLARAPLAGAIVRIMGERDSAVTDSMGAFALTVAASRERIVTVRHPRLGLVADNSSQSVSLLPGGEARIEAHVPSVEAFVRTFCGEERGSAGLLGLALGDDGAPAEGLTVRVTWWLTGAAAVRQELTRSVARGLYALCRLPPERNLTVRLEDGSRVIVERTMRLASGEFRWLDLRAGASRREPGPGTGLSSMTERAGLRPAFAAASSRPRPALPGR
jgi:hypothetical protein